MIALQDALERLLTDAAYRAAFVAGDLAALDLSDDDARALSSVDARQLTLVADKVREAVVHRRYRGSGGIATWYPQTLAGRDLDEVSAAFLASARFTEWRELPHAGRGLCLEEAFFRFCEDQGIGDPAVRESEFLAAMARALATNASPSFTLPPELHVVPGGVAGITRLSGPTLHAAVRGKVVTGALTPFLAELVRAEAEPADVAAHHGVSPAVLDASQRQLRQMGLLALGV